MEFDNDTWNRFGTIQLMALANHKAKTLANEQKAATFEEAMEYARELANLCSMLHIICVRLSNRLAELDPDGKSP